MGRWTKQRLGISAAAVLAAGASWARGDIVANGDFETGTFAAWAWTADDGAGSYQVPEVVDFLGSRMFRVNFGPAVVTLPEEIGGTLGQTVRLSAGTAYTLSGLLVLHNPTDTFLAEAGSVDVELDGVEQTHLEQEQIGPGEVVTSRFSVDFTVDAAGDHALEVHFGRSYPGFDPDAGGPVIYGYVDDVSIVPSPGAELVLAASGCLALGRRRRVGR
jgi:hypothetical protein